MPLLDGRDAEALLPRLAPALDCPRSYDWRVCAELPAPEKALSRLPAEGEERS